MKSYNDIQKHEQEIYGLSKELNKNTEKLSELQQTLTQVKNLANENESEINNISDNLNDYVQECIEIGQKVIENTENIENLQSAVNANTEEISRLSENLENLGTNEEVEGQIQELSTELEALKTTVSTNTSNISSNKSNITTNTTNITTLRADINQLIKDFNSHEWHFLHLKDFVYRLKEGQNIHNENLFFVEDITQLNSKKEEEIFNNGCERKFRYISIGSGLIEIPIFFRTLPSETDVEIEVEFYLKDIPFYFSGYVAIVTLDDEVISSGMMVVFNSTMEHQGKITFTMPARMSHKISHYLKIVLSAPDLNGEAGVSVIDSDGVTTLVYPYLDAVKIKITGAPNAMVLNRDMEFNAEFWQERNQSQKFASYVNRFYGRDLRWYFVSCDYANINIAKFQGYLDNMKNFDQGILHGQIVRRTIVDGFRSRPFSSTDYTLYANLVCVCGESRQVKAYYSQTNSNQPTNLKNVIQISNNLCFPGITQSNPCVVGVFKDQSPFITRIIDNVTFKPTLAGGDLPSEFVQVVPVLDPYFLNRANTNQVEKGYIMLHKSGYLLFFPSKNSVYGINLGLGTQPKAYYTSENTIRIFVLFEGKIIMKKLIRDVATARWKLSSDELVLDEYDNIQEWFFRVAVTKTGDNYYASETPDKIKNF